MHLATIVKVIGPLWVRSCPPFECAISLDDNEVSGVEVGQIRGLCCWCDVTQYWLLFVPKLPCTIIAACMRQAPDSWGKLKAVGLYIGVCYVWSKNQLKSIHMGWSTQFPLSNCIALVSWWVVAVSQYCHPRPLQSHAHLWWVPGTPPTNLLCVSGPMQPQFGHPTG